MRAHLADMVSPHPLGQTLPALYLDDPFTQRLCAALDDVLAPVLNTLDNLPSYFDLDTTPEDLLPWLAHWIGMGVDPAQAPARQRKLLQAAGVRQGSQGTRLGIAMAVEALFALPVEVMDSGGATWSTSAADPLPGEPVAAVVVQVYPAPGQDVDEERLEYVVASIKPAHAMHRVHVVWPDEGEDEEAVEV